MVPPNEATIWVSLSGILVGCKIQVHTFNGGVGEDFAVRVSIVSEAFFSRRCGWFTEDWLTSEMVVEAKAGAKCDKGTYMHIAVRPRFSGWWRSVSGTV